jgi:hypothetical protein
MWTKSGHWKYQVLGSIRYQEFLLQKMPLAHANYWPRMRYLVTPRHL